MKMRTLGKNGPKVSAVGLGCMVMTGDYGPADEAESIATIRHALDIGVNFLDTADVYGKNENERIVGKALKGRRADAFIATKFGNTHEPDGSRGQNGRPDYVPVACDGSLKRLGVDVIDLYYLHRADPKVPLEDTVGAMAKLVQAGKVRHIGLSEVSAASLRKAHATHPITALQSEYSLFTRDHEAEVIPTCRELGIAFVPFSPLGRAMLAGVVNGREALGKDDKRHRHPRFNAGNLERNIDLMVPLRQAAERAGCTVAQAALAWLLSRGDDIVPIPGTRRQAHVDANAASADVRLDPTDLARLDATFTPDKIAGERTSAERLATVGR